MLSLSGFSDDHVFICCLHLDRTAVLSCIKLIAGGPFSRKDRFLAEGYHPEEIRRLRFAALNEEHDYFLCVTMINVHFPKFISNVTCAMS